MPKIYRKGDLEENVYEAALERFRYLFAHFDRVVVSFSGGKDSTVCLNLALEVARETGRLPLECYFWDEEAIQPETVEYVERVRQNPDIRLKWLCVPIAHRNACSRKQPYWHCWNPAEEALWCRPMPEGAITMIPGFFWGATVPDIAHLVYGREGGTVADVRGIRADESIRRYRSVASKLKDNWIGHARAGYSYPVSPIYDWTAFDVWTAPRLFGWDYNRAYDIMSLAGKRIIDQRVCPPFGEEPLEGLGMYAECWPDLWHKMVNRVHGAATAGKYSTTELYAYGKLSRPPGLSWREWTYRLLDLYPPDLRKVVAAGLGRMIETHKTKTNRPIPEDEADPLSGLSWAYLAMIANRGDLKGRRSGMLVNEAIGTRKRRKMTLEEAEDSERGSEHGRY